MPKKKLKLTDERSYYKPFNYPWAFDAFKSSEQMHWLWTEVEATVHRCNDVSWVSMDYRTGSLGILLKEPVHVQLP